MAKWQQGEKDPFLVQVEESVNGLGCSLHLPSDTNSYDWYKWHGINTSSQAVDYWKQLWLAAVPILFQLKAYCVLCLKTQSEWIPPKAPPADFG